MIEPKTTNDILLRDDFTCQACGAAQEDLADGETMRVGVIVRNDPKVPTTALDLKTLCPECDEGFATAPPLPRMNARELIKEFSLMSPADQRVVVDSLFKK